MPSKSFRTFLLIFPLILPALALGQDTTASYVRDTPGLHQEFHGDTVVFMRALPGDLPQSDTLKIVRPGRSDEYRAINPYAQPGPASLLWSKRLEFGYPLEVQAKYPFVPTRSEVASIGRTTYPWHITLDRRVTIWRKSGSRAYQEITPRPAPKEPKRQKERVITAPPDTVRADTTRKP